MKPNLTQAQANHLRRLLAWIRCEIGMAPEELQAFWTETERQEMLRRAFPDEAGQQRVKQRLLEDHEKARYAPKYVRAAIKALEKLLVKQEGEIVDVEAAPGFDAGIEIGGTCHGPLPALPGTQLGSAPLPALSAPHPWSDQAPTEPGWYRFTCDEIHGATERVLVVIDRLSGQLLAVETTVGTLDLQHYHDGLTNPRWEKVQGRCKDDRLQDGGRPYGRY